MSVLGLSAAGGGSGPSERGPGWTAEQTTFTREQLDAIERRDGELFLDAGAGSGKTSVLVERFVRAVLEDEIGVSAILTITFTDKAAAEMRERIRARLRELGATEAARATEGAFISTIHGFCARVLRAHALAAGIDPAFTVLDQLEAGRLGDAAFDGALVDLADNAPGGVELVAAYGMWDLRGAIQGVYGELRSRGELNPRLPLGGVSDGGGVGTGLEPEAAGQELEEAAAAAAAELAAVPDPSTRVIQALERLERLGAVLSAAEPWPGDLDRLRLPGGNGAALGTPVCVAYTEALARLREASEQRWAQRTLALFDRLLDGYGVRYERAKRERSGLDFEDLELLCRELLRSDHELRDRYRDRFERVMVDELQDTNAVQLELIEMISSGNLFTVGDSQQSIYGFRHADVELFERRGERLAGEGARATLQTNFRSRAEILEVVNRTFAGELGERFMALSPGRGEPRADGREPPADEREPPAEEPEPPTDEPRVELLIADKGAEWAPAEGLSAPWRVAEARGLAQRVGELIDAGAAAGDVVVLTRATTDMRAYEHALEERGIPTYVIGGRGYWSHPQVVDLVAYLKVLANPRDEEALYTLLASPLVGVSPDALVLLAAAARDGGRDPWWVLREPEGRLDEVSAEDGTRLAGFAAWMVHERMGVPRKGVEDLIERALDHTGYDLAVLAMPGGQRRLANVRKLMRLGRQHDAARGPDLRGFLDLVRIRSDSWRADPDQSEAPVESEALDAVRLMTIHRAKGLEFEIVCVADLGRGPRWSSEVLRVGRDGRIGLRLARPGTGRRESALAYDELGEERKAAEALEERRVFYVAMTRARERLIVSGAAKLDPSGSGGLGGGGPIAWLGPALVPDLAARVGEGSGVAEGVRFTVVRPDDVDDAGPERPPATAGRERPPVDGSPERPPVDLDDRADAMREFDRPGTPGTPEVPAPEPRVAELGPPVTSLSYTSLAAYQRCGYRFYAERVLGLPGTDRRGQGPDAVGPAAGGSAAGASAAGDRAAGAAVLTPAERGTVVHELLERLDFRRPVVPAAPVIAAAAPRTPSVAELDDIAALVGRFAATELCARLGRARGVRREQRFGFLLDRALITGMLDVIASQPRNRMLIVDYKTDRLEPSGERSDPAAVVAAAYATQRLVYALAALRSGAEEVEVVHVFLEAPDELVVATFTSAQAAELEAQLVGLVEGVMRRQFVVADVPHREICSGCPAEGGLCSWPLEMTRREAPDRLF
jgi:ATP-dependent helicase/nuclease subunit A